MSLEENVTLVRRRIEEACRRCGRSSSTVTLVAVTKNVGIEVIRQALALGLCDVGENRVQEARTKRIALGSRFKAQGSGLEPPALSLQPTRWHLIGSLQRNKVKHAIELFDVIHSVDSIEIIEELERNVSGRPLSAGGKTKSLEVFIQVNVSGETTKHGCRPDEVQLLAKRLLLSRYVVLKGLMTIAPLMENPEETRPYFHHIRQLRDETTLALSLEPRALSLSMGMSNDFEIAIEEGADVVRIGTAVFGEKPT